MPSQFKDVACTLFAFVIVVGLSSSPTAAIASIVTYSVDFSGTDFFSGDTLRVFGTITLDADLPVGSAIVDSDLHFQHASDPIVDLPQIPEYYSDTANYLEWQDDGGDLYINRINPFPNPETTRVRWRANPGRAFDGFEFGSGATPHTIQFENLPFDAKYVFLKHSGGPDGPNGFLVGTSIPEPTSSMFVVGLIGVVFSVRRGTRKKVVRLFDR